MPVAKTAADRHPGFGSRPDAIRQPVRISFRQAWHRTNPWANPHAWVKPNGEPDAEPKSEADPQAQPEAKGVANPNLESLPDLDFNCVAQRLAEHGTYRRRHRHGYGYALHA